MLSTCCRAGASGKFTGLLRGPSVAGDMPGTEYAALARSVVPALRRSSRTLRNPVAVLHSASGAWSCAPLLETGAWGYGADGWGPCSRCRRNAVSESPDSSRGGW